MKAANFNLLWAHALVDELARDVAQVGHSPRAQM